MIQTGDPTGTGKGGESVWGKPFQDEIRSTLKVSTTRKGASGINERERERESRRGSGERMNNDSNTFKSSMGKGVGSTNVLHQDS